MRVAVLGCMVTALWVGRAGAQEEFLHVHRDTFGCLDPQAVRAINNQGDPRQTDPRWRGYVTSRGGCVQITPNSPWRRLRSADGLMFMEYAGTAGAPGRFWVQEGDLAEQRDASVAASPDVPQPSFAMGVSDRNAFDKWFNSLNGDVKAGADFWVMVRSRPRASCATGEKPADSDWMRGCLATVQMIRPLDARRRSSPEYRLGWNSVKTEEVQVSAPETKPAQTVAAPEPTPAAPKVASSACAQIMSATERLDCYDRGEQPEKSRIAALAAAPSSTAPDTTTEQRFISLVQNAATEYKQAPNDMLKGAAKANRSAAICGILPSASVQDWTGTIELLSSNGDGDGVLSIKIADTISVKTWNNALSDFRSHTLIQSSSSIFKAVSSMAVGAKVKFSGSFIQEGRECAKESSLTMSGSMSEPEFVFRFSSVSPM